MKKFLTLIVALAATFTLSAKETTVWTGNEPISWNPEVYDGNQYETPDGTFTGLQSGYTIKVSVTPGIDEPQYVMTYKAGDSWDWTDLTTTIENGTMTYTVASAQIATEIAERGLIFRGQGYNITAIIVDDNTPDTPEPVTPSLNEKTLWTGDSAISWNPEAYPGGQFETEATLFAGLKKDDTIRVYIAEAIDGAQFALTYKAGDAWNWTDLTISVENSVMTYVVESETIAAEIAERGLIVRGQGYHIVRIALCAYQSDEEQPVEPAAEYTDTEVWTGNTAISWNAEEYPGEQFDTYTVLQDMFAGLAKDDSIKVYYSEAIEGAQFALTYKAGDEWAWTDLTITQHDGFFAYKVASDEIAQDIADHGLVIRGQGYHATAIVIGKPENTPSAINTIESDKIGGAQKILRNGQLFIVNKGVIYNVQGQVIQ
ncbi:MAG: hypothetical protein IJS13_07555 [Paludibacteraceae bacterium]|nr:hypothetical protein [Paludibacteraceae bacterium]